MTPDQYCQDRAARSGSSFYYSFLFLPPDRRRAITALYAFCREVDDVVDEIADPQLARTKLDWWRDETRRLYAGVPEHPVTRALAPHLAAFSVDRVLLEEIIEGMQMDLDHSQFADFASLRLYCHRVAGVVGILASRIFGASDPQTSRFAETLGQAFQLTNIIRDVGEDARRGRIYLPRDELARDGVAPDDILGCQHTPALESHLRAQAARARELYRAAYALLPETDRRSQRPALIMATIYSALLDEIEDDGFRVLHRRVSLTPIRKLWLAWRTWVGGRPLPPRPV